MAIVLLDEEAEELEEESRPARKGIFLDSEDEQEKIPDRAMGPGIHLDPEEEQPLLQEEEPGWLTKSYNESLGKYFDWVDKNEPEARKIRQEKRKPTNDVQVATFDLLSKLPPNMPAFYREDMLKDISDLVKEDKLFTEEGLQKMSLYVGEEEARKILTGEEHFYRDISLEQAIREGQQESVLGIVSGHGVEDYEQILERAETELPFLKRNAKMVSKLIGDLPAFAAGGTAAIPFGGYTNPVGAVIGTAGGFATQQLIERSYEEALRLVDAHPELKDKTLDQIAAIVQDPEALKNIGISALEAGSLGALLAVNPLLRYLQKTPLAKYLKMPVIGTAIKGGTEVATLTVPPAAIRGKIPTPQDILDNAVLILGTKVAFGPAEKISKWAEKKKYTTDDVQSKLGEKFTKKDEELLAAAKTEEAAADILQSVEERPPEKKEPTRAVEEKPVKKQVEERKPKVEPVEAKQREAIEEKPLKAEKIPEDTEEFWKDELNKAEKVVEEEKNLIEEYKKELKKTRERIKKGEKNLTTKNLEFLIKAAKERLKEANKLVETRKNQIESIKKGIKPSKTRSGLFQPEQKNLLPEMGKEKEVPSKSSIINLFRDAFQETPIRIGKIKQGPKKKGTILGLFKPKENVIRMKEANDIETAAHEFGHKLHYALYGEGKDVKAQTNAVNKALRPYSSELVPISRYAPHLIEGFAEFTRMYVTNPEGAQTLAPAYYKHFEQILDKKAPKVKEALSLARDQYKRYLKGDPVARVYSHVQSSFDRGALEKGKDWFNKKFNLDRIKTNWLDELYPIKRAVADTLGISPTEVENWKSPLNPYIQARVFKGWVGKANEMIFNKTFDFKTLRPNGKGLKEILEPIKTNGERQDLVAYLIAKRAKLLHKRGIKSGIDQMTIDETYKRLEKKYDKISEELNDYQNRVLRYAVDSGLFSNDQYKKMKELNEFYVPFYRVFEEGEKNIGKGMGANTSTLQAQKGLKRIFGSTREIVDPIESMIKNTLMLVQNAEKNELAQTMSKLSSINPRGGKYMEKVPPKMRKIFELEQEELLEEIGKEARRKDPFHEVTNSDEEAMDIAAELLPESISRWTATGWGPRENVITVYFDGKPKYYETIPEIARLFKQGGLSNVYSHPLVKILALPAKVLRAGAILNPKFIEKNAVRDLLGGFLYTKNPKGIMDIIYQPIAGLAHAIKQDKLYHDWMRAGGGMSTMQSIDKSMSTLMDVLGKDWQKKMNPIYWMRKGSEISEEMNRLAEYSKAIDNMGTDRWQKQMAAFQSRDLSVDFAKYGYYAKALNQIIPFWNATVQGGEKLARTLASGDPEVLKNFALRATSSIAIPSLILAMMNQGDKEIEELPEVTKDTNFIFRSPLTGKLTKIPVPFEPGVIINGLVRRFYNFVVNKDPNAFEGFFGSIKGAVTPGFMPTALEPFYEVWANKDLYYNTHIVPPSKVGLISEEQYDTFTSESAKIIAKAMSYMPGIDEMESSLTSPAIIEHFIRSWTGGLGNLTLKLSDKALEQTGVKPEIEKPALEFAEEYGLNAFKQRYPISRTKSVERFYEVAAKWNKYQRSIETKIEKRDIEGAKKIRKEQEKIAPPAMKSYQKVLNDNQKAINNVYRNPKMSAEEKRELIDKLYLRKIQMARAFMTQIDKYQKGKS